MKVYSLTKKGNEALKSADPQSHAGAVIGAVKSLGNKATSKQIIEKVTPILSKVSNMKPSKATAFMLYHLSRERGGNLLSAREAK